MNWIIYAEGSEFEPWTPHFPTFKMCELRNWLFYDQQGYFVEKSEGNAKHLLRKSMVAIMQDQNCTTF